MIYIADIGSNWRISNDMAENWLHTADLMLAVAQAGFTFVKFQAWNTESFIHLKHPQYTSYYERYELPEDWYSELVKLGKNFGINVMFTPFDNVSLTNLADLDLPSWKIASSDATCLPLISNVSKLAKEIFISFGNTTIDEVRTTVNSLKEFDGNVCLMHCVPKYPMQLKDAGFARISELRNEFPDYKLGWSSHSLPVDAEYLANVAVAMGVEVLEVHVRAESQPTRSPDYKHSLTPNQLGLLKQSITKTKNIMESKCTLDLHEINWARRNPVTGKRPTIEPIRE